MCFIPHVHLQTPPHTVQLHLFKKKAFRVGAWRLCHPLTRHNDGGDKTPMCLTHRPPEQRHSSVTEMEYGRTELPPCSEHLTSVCWYQMWRFSREPRKCTVGENMTETQTEREREVPNGVRVPWQTDTGHNNLLWIRFIVCPVLLTLLPFFSWPANHLPLTHSNPFNALLLPKMTSRNGDTMYLKMQLIRLRPQ